MSSSINQTPTQTTHLDKPAHNQLLVRDAQYYKKEPFIWLLLALAGVCLGFSAPGWGHWYLAWFGLTPLFLATLTSRNIPEAFFRGVQFGFGYFLVYLVVILQFTNDVWPDSLKSHIWLANPIVWLLVSLQQGALAGTFASMVRFLPLTLGFLPRRENGSWKIPALLVVPLIWCLIYNKLGNYQLSMSIPWALLEYTQYEQKNLVQIANLIGGIGISALIIMTNLAIASFVANIAKLKGWFVNIPGTLKFATLNLLVVAGLLTAINIYGHERIKASRILAENAPHETVSLLQGNMLFGTTHKDSRIFFRNYLKLAASAPAGICIWPEWSIPVPVREKNMGTGILTQNATQNNQDWVIGCIDRNAEGKLYNSVCGITRSGKLLDYIYHKRFLVPFAEYTPHWVLKSPLGFLCGTLTPRREGFSIGKTTKVFELTGKKIAPLLCCELASPELACEGVRKGGQLLVDCSNTSWFESKIIGKQCIAACVIRAIENHRCLAFATTLGPSVIVDAEGVVRAKTSMNEADTVSSEVPFYSDLTVFTRWFK